MILVTPLHILRILPTADFKTLTHVPVLALSHTQRHEITCECAHIQALTPVVKAVIVVVVLVVVLQARGAAGTQLCQSTAGGGELGAQVGHFLAGRLDGPINPLCQLFVVFHHFKDFPLRTKSTQSSMVSREALQEVKLRPFPPPPRLITLFFFFSYSTCAFSLTVYFAHKKKKSRQYRDDVYLLLHKECVQALQSQRKHVCARGESERGRKRGREKPKGAGRERKKGRGEKDAAQQAEGKVNAPAEENVL